MDADTWRSFTEAQSAMENEIVKCNGIGFVFTKSDPFVAVKHHNCVTLDGRVLNKGSFLALIMSSYTEIDPSNSSLLTILRGSDPEGPTRIAALEICDRERFFPIIGKCFIPTGSTPPRFECHSR